MKHVVTFEIGDRVAATIMTQRQLSETKSSIVEALEVEDHKAEELLARVEASIKAGDSGLNAAATPANRSPSM